MTLQLYTAWGSEDDPAPTVLIPGESPPRFCDGTLQPDSEKLFWKIEAATWEEAMAIHYLRQGWGRYDPGPPASCPDGGAVNTDPGTPA